MSFVSVKDVYKRQMYSLSLFALSLFQVTATQSRPLILGMLASNAADIAAEYRIIEVIPLFIIVVGGTLTGIFLPKSSELIAQKNQDEIEKFAYKGTTITTILANISVSYTHLMKIKNSSKHSSKVIY